MSKTTALIAVVGSLASLLVAVPLSDEKNQRNAMFPLTGNIRMIPSNQRGNTLLECEKPGFFADPTNCSQFYRCVDIGETGYFSTFAFECTSGVFYEKSVSCIEGPCPNLGPQYGKPPITDPAPPPPPNSPRPPADFPRPNPLKPPPINPPEILPDSMFVAGLADFPPAPPEPPQPTPETPDTSTTEAPDTQKPQWMNEAPSWFKETPWWFNTAPSWFHQPPAWFNGVPTVTAIEEDITIEDSEPIVTEIDVETAKLPSNNEKNINTGEVSITGPGASFITDRKTIRIRIPIHIVQQ